MVDGERLNTSRVAIDRAGVEVGLVDPANLQSVGVISNRYVWDADLGFRGFTADLIIKIDGGAPLPVMVRVSPTLEVEIDAPDPTTKAYVHEEMSQFITHRQPRKPFDSWYGPDKAKFKLGKELPEGREVFIAGDAMGSN